jgi:hypothetical protein
MRILHNAVWLVALPAVLHAQEEKKEMPRFSSPDKKWEFRVTGETAALVKADSEVTAVNLGEEIGYLATETGQLIWAPDSRRFAFNSRKGGRYYGCDLYELAGDTWKKLPSIEENTKAAGEIIERAMRKQLKRLGAKPDATLNMVMSKARVLRWLTNDIFEGYISEQRRIVVNKNDEDWEYLGSAVLFKGKCDNRGRWKIVSTRELSDAEFEKLSAQD